MILSARRLTQIVLIVALVPTPAIAQASAAVDGDCSYERVENLTFPSQARAQAVPFANLSGRIKRGHSVTLLDADGGCIQGRVVDLTPSTLTLLINKAEQRSFPEGTVQRIMLRDSLWNGAIIGFVVGIIPGAIAGGFQGAFHGAYCKDSPKGCDSDSGASAKPLVIGGGIGALIGLGIDVASERTFNISRPRGARVTVSPVISADRQAMHVSLRF